MANQVLPIAMEQYLLNKVGLIEIYPRGVALQR